jgi:hypothetical protein
MIEVDANVTSAVLIDVEALEAVEDEPFDEPEADNTR